MQFFFDEILENDEIRAIMEHDDASFARAEKIIEDYFATGEMKWPEPGIQPLFILAKLADYALEKNNKRGIPKEITVATLKDVNVWIDNYYAQFGELGFGECSWLILHYTGDLFRIGRLQYRIAKAMKGTPSGDVTIETHIPQDGSFDIAGILDSMKRAKEFFATYFPEAKPEYFVTDSWLLNKNIADILPETSNIVRFTKLWTYIEPFPSDNSWQAIERIYGFGVKRADLADAPERTTLQKKAKPYLLAGGNLDMKAGYCKIDSIG